MANPLVIILAVIAGTALLSKSKKTLPKSSQDTEEEIAVLDYDESPEPVVSPNKAGPPLLGASSCFGPMAGGRSRLSKNVLDLMDKNAKALVIPSDGRYTWVDNRGNVRVFSQGITVLSEFGQVAAFNAALEMISGPDRSILSIMTRRILTKLMPNCNWYADLWPSDGHVSLPKDQYNMWVSVWYLVNAAAKQKKYKVGGKTPAKSLLGPAEGGPGLIVGRGFLDMPEVATVGNINLEVGRRVELIVGEYQKSQLPIPPFFHGESIYAYVVDPNEGAPIVEVIKTFQGRDVSPKFAHRHGFDIGRRIGLHASGTTGLRRIFQAGAA